MATEYLPVFVYGTLKRGQQRESMWPTPATCIEEATTRGRLYDLGPYPAMVAGPDLIAGELWYVVPSDLDVTLAALDEIECFGINDVDLYVRRVVECHTPCGTLQPAYTYHFADVSALAGRPAMPPAADGCCRWPAHDDGPMTKE